MSRPGLAILIPSFNQPTGAITTVEFISKVRQEHSFLVEVLLSDNRSDDVAYLAELERYESEGWLKVFRQQENLGFSANVRFLATQAEANFSLVIGCGDLPHFSNLGGILRRLAEFDPSPAIVVGSVTSHGPKSAFDVVEGSNLNLDSYHKLKSSWAPYQEAISGQIYSSSFLRDLWPLVAKSGNAWPHIEASIKQALLKEPLIYRTALPIASIHQDFSGWYYQVGANYQHLAKHLVILFPNIFTAGLGVFVKAISLIFNGLPRALAQDLEAVIRRHLR